MEKIIIDGNAFDYLTPEEYLDHIVLIAKTEEELSVIKEICSHSEQTILDGPEACIVHLKITQIISSYSFDGVVAMVYCEFYNTEKEY